MNDFGPAVLAVILGIFELLGIFFIGDLITATTLNNNKWNCTEVTLDRGKPACIKYERIKK